MTTRPPLATDAPIEAIIRHLLEEQDPSERARIYDHHHAGYELLQSLKDEVDRLKDADGNQALVAGQRAFELSRILSEPRAEALGSWALALGLTVQGRFEEALPNFEQARQGYLQLGEPDQAARVGIPSGYRLWP